MHKFSTLRAALSRPELAQARAILPAFLILLGFAVFQPDMVHPANLWNIAMQTSYLAMFTLGQSIVLLTAGLDLSIGVAVSVVSLVASLCMVQFSSHPTLAVVTFIVAGIGVGILIGAVNGFFVAIVGVNPFVVTLGTFNILLALSSTVTAGFPVSNFPGLLPRILVDSTVLGVPTPIVITVALFLVVGGVLTRTVYGRSLYLIGSNRSMASVAGINIRLHLFGAYVLCSVLAAIGAILLTARAGSGEPNIGGSLALQTFAAAVIGGTRLSGGEGGAFAALVGAFFITVLSNGMDLTHSTGDIQQFSLGAIIVLKLLGERFSRRSNRLT